MRNIGRICARNLLVGTFMLTLPATTLYAAGMGGGGAAPAPSTNVPEFDAAAEYRKGVDALQAKKFAEAKRAFDRVLRVNGRDGNTNYLAGLANAGLDDYKKAAKHFDKAVKADKTNVQARQQLAISHAKTGDAAKAQAELDALKQQQAACAETCPQAAALKSAVSAVTSAMGQPQARMDTAPGLLFQSAAAGDHAYLDAVGMINEGRYDAAIAELQKAKAAFGAHPDVLTYMGFANRKLGRFAVAEGYYREALVAAPNHKGATEYFGELMVERGDLAGATKMLAKLDAICTFGCAEADELRRWVKAGHSPVS